MKYVRYKKFFVSLIGPLFVILAVGSITWFIRKMRFSNAPAISGTLPQPTGKFGVGTTSYFLIDKQRKETYSTDPEHPFRELMVYAWYPTVKSVDAKTTRYFDNKEAASIEKKTLAGMLEVKPSELDYLDNLKTNAAPHASVSQDFSNYPVLIFLPGFGGSHSSYHLLLEELASHGFIVFFLNLPYVTFPNIMPDGRIIEQSKVLEATMKDKDREKRTRFLIEEQEKGLLDISFLLNELKSINKNDPNGLLTGKLDLSEIGILGHSFGGSEAVHACNKFKQIKACVNLDGKLRGKEDVRFDKPCMIILSDRFLDNNKSSAREVTEFGKLLSSIKSKTYNVMIEGVHHTSFSNFFNIVNASKLAWFKPWLEKLQPIAATRMINELVVAFFDAFLKAGSTEKLQKLITQSSIIRQNMTSEEMYQYFLKQHKGEKIEYPEK